MWCIRQNVGLGLNIQILLLFATSILWLLEPFISLLCPSFRVSFVHSFIKHLLGDSTVPRHTARNPGTGEGAKTWSLFPAWAMEPTTLMGGAADIWRLNYNAVWKVISYCLRDTHSTLHTSRRHWLILSGVREGFMKVLTIKSCIENEKRLCLIHPCINISQSTECSVTHNRPPVVNWILICKPELVWRSVPSRVSGHSSVPLSSTVQACNSFSISTPGWLKA